MNLNWHDVWLAAEHLAGFVIVMLALTVLWGLTALMGRIFSRRAARSGQAVTLPRAAAPATPGPAADGLTDDEIVVVAAAVAAMFGGRHRVVSVRPVHSSWGDQGRREIHASHRIR